MKFDYLQNRTLFVIIAIFILLAVIFNHKDRFFGAQESEYAIRQDNFLRTDFQKLEAKFSGDVYLNSVYTKLPDYKEEELALDMENYFQSFNLNEVEKAYIWQSVFLNYAKTKRKNDLDNLFLKVFAENAVNTKIFSDIRSYSGWNLTAILLSHRVDRLEQDFEIISRIPPFGGGLYQLDDSSLAKINQIARHSYNTDANFKTISIYAYVTMLSIPFLKDQNIKLSEETKLLSLVKEALPFAKENIQNFSTEGLDSNPSKILYFAIPFVVLERKGLISTEETEISSEELNEFVVNYLNSYSESKNLYRYILLNFFRVNYSLLVGNIPELKASMSEFEQNASKLSIPFVYFQSGRSEDTFLKDLQVYDPTFTKKPRK